MKLNKFKIDKWLIICIILFFLISIISIRSAEILLGTKDLMYKQIMWYGIGFILILIMIKLKNQFIFKHIWIFYCIGIITLILLLIFGEPVNNAKCWFKIPGIGTFQPSEFMKIILIITIACMTNNFNTKYPNPTKLNEFIFLIKIMIIVLIPSIITFLQPDTGVVLIYLLITFIMLFISGIRYRWFIICILIAIISIGSIVFIYFYNQNMFIDIFGTSFFLRIDRLLDWSNNSGYQLENGLSAIGSGGLLGYGVNNTPIYFPEPQTDFIFAVYSSNFGFLGSLFLISLIAFFDIKLIILALHNNNNINKYLISGIIGMLLYQQIQNIGMTIGLLPITGITLPFISYGGSSLLSYMLMLGFIFNISNETIKQ
ncbi:MAG: FtsW/RodA/SpoVE family cell cycle protein [Bacilli bacterium]|nr:FtsW/RodA/SpoVE family cell cycle protein [Bacilli bacterium]